MADPGHYSLARIRRGAGHFLVGKALSAALTFGSFAMVARLLGASDYGAYAAVLACTELLLSLGTFGMDWAVARFLPEYRTRGTRRQLKRFTTAVVAFQALSIAIAMSLAALAAHWLSARLGAGADFVTLYAGVMFVEGMARVLRDQLLAGLLAQRAAQTCAVIRGGVLLLLLTLHPWIGDLTGSALGFVAAAEGTAAAAALVFGALSLTRLLRRHQPDPEPDDGTAWQAPALAAVAGVAVSAYLGMLLVMPAGGPLLTLVLAQFAGPQAAGAFGFARGLVEQIRRFLPVELFLGLVRPGLVARYAQARDFEWLNRRLWLLFAVSAVSAMPVIALLVAQAPLVTGAVAGASFADAAPILALWSGTLLLFPLRRTVEIAAHTVERSSACVAGGFALAATPLLVVAALLSGATVTWALSTALVADAAFSAIVIQALWRRGFRHRWSVSTLGYLVALQAAACALLAGLPSPVGTATASLLIAACAATLLTWGVAAVVKPFTPEDRELLNGLLKRPWFPF